MNTRTFTRTQLFGLLRVHAVGGEQPITTVRVSSVSKNTLRALYNRKLVELTAAEQLVRCTAAGALVVAAVKLVMKEE